MANDATSPPENARLRLTGLATVGLDLDGRITQWGPGAVRLFGWSAADALGNDIRDVLPHQGHPGAGVGAVLSTVTTGDDWNDVFPVECADGHIENVEFRGELQTSADGRTSVAVSASRTVASPGVDTDGATTADGPGLALLNDASARIGTTLEPGETAREIMDVAVPRLADAASVFVLERLLAEEEFPRATDGSAVVRRLATRLSSGDLAAPPAGIPGDAVVFPAHSAYARCMATRAPVHFDREAGDGSETLGSEELLGDFPRQRYFLAVPLRARGRALGFVVLTRGQGSMSFSVHDTALAGGLAARAAVCIDNACLYKRERRTARVLQESMLPSELVPPPELEVAHRYLPASDVAQVGGDWYDVFPLPDGRIALVAGDAMGHDTAAAAAMGQLRTAVRTLASLDLPAGDVLCRLDQTAQVLNAAQFATCVYVTCDPAAGSCTIARAGHVPPILVQPSGGKTTVLEGPPGLLLGVGGGTFEAIEVEFPPGSTLALYTDGLVESRERDLDAGTAALRNALAGSSASLEETCGAIVESLRQPDNEDDITLLLARPRLSPQA